MTHTDVLDSIMSTFYMNKVILLIVITVVHSKYRLHKDYYLTLNPRCAYKYEPHLHTLYRGTHIYICFTGCQIKYWWKGHHS